MENRKLNKQTNKKPKKLLCIKRNRHESEKITYHLGENTGLLSQKVLGPRRCKTELS
jgi:hypothetical protein